MSRIKSLDLARGFTVLMMAPIHTMMVFSNLSLRSTLLAQILAFIAEWHGAQVFMLIMGISFSLSGGLSLESVFLKATRLMALAYLLNIFKLVLPHLFGWLPDSLLSELQVDKGAPGYLQLFLLGDILQFASISLIVMAIVSKFKFSGTIALWVAMAICIISPLFWDVASNNNFVTYLLNLIGGQPPQIFFPLFPWLVYPLLGFYIGGILQKKEQWLGFDSFWIVGLALIVLSSAVKYLLHSNDLSSFYRTTPLDTLLHIGFVLTMLSFWHWVQKNVKPNILFKLFTYCSKQITQIYFIQWVLICWLLAFIDYQQSGFMVSIFLIFVNSIATLMLSLIIQMIKTDKSSKHYRNTL
jgi:uncharacterized membrane protein